jgi:cation:H+ antiporter
MGADLLVRGSVALARKTRVSSAAVAATVIGFGTSLPELVVSVQATLTGHAGLILGNVVGSNTANILLVGGVSAVLFPIVYPEGRGRKDTTIMMVAAIGFTAVCALGTLGRPVGLALLLGFFAVMTLTAGETIQDQMKSDTTVPLEWVLGLPSSAGMIAFFVVLGLAMLPLGAYLLVDSAVEIAEAFGVSEPVIGLTVVAVGTSMPELATSALAALEKRPDVAIGTIVGSNTFNVLVIMGVSAVLSSTPISVSTRFLFLDLPTMLAASTVLVAYAWSRREMGRVAGIAMTTGYVAYIAVLIWLV